MSMPSTTANWHWKNKNITRWAKEWFERELVTITVKGDAEGESVSISEVKEVDGDVELGQRKSKLITIFDCKIEMEWKGTASDGTEVNGKVTVPEVSHEVTVDGLSDYQYEWSMSTASSQPVDVILKLARSRLPAALEAKFTEFAAAIVDTHGKDLTVSTEPSRSGTPANASTPAAPAAVGSVPVAKATPAVKSAKKESLNTTRVSVNATFMAAADDLYDILTNEKRIPMWTRAPAQSTPQVGSSFSLFGGGVKGTYASLTPPKEIVQNWALQSPTWPEGHTGTLTTTLDQSSDSTKVTFSLDGVPKGLEDEITRNLEGYYIHGLKSIGYVRLFPSPPSIRERTPSKSPNSKKSSDTGRPYITAIFIAALAFAAAFSIPYLSASK